MNNGNYADPKMFFIIVLIGISIYLVNIANMDKDIIIEEQPETIYFR